MTPKAIRFDRESILAAAIKVVREAGFENLSARSVARQLKASVAPVYSTFRSMDDLARAVLEAARQSMDEQTRHPFSDIPFLNLGVGIVVFARDEKRLFQALFLSPHHYQDILERFQDSVFLRMHEDPMLLLMPDASLKRLLESIWLYTLGLSTAIVYGQLSDTSTGTITRLLKDMGNILMFAEVSGLADCESPANEKEWARLIREKGLVVPSPAACPSGDLQTQNKQEDK